MKIYNTNTVWRSIKWLSVIFIALLLFILITKRKYVVIQQNESLDKSIPLGYVEHNTLSVSTSNAPIIVSHKKSTTMNGHVKQQSDEHSFNGVASRIKKITPNGYDGSTVKLLIYSVGSEQQTSSVRIYRKDDNFGGQYVLEGANILEIAFADKPEGYRVLGKGVDYVARSGSKSAEFRLGEDLIDGSLVVLDWKSE